MRLVLCDLDGTLLAAPSAELAFVRWMALRGRLGPRGLLAWTAFLARELPRYGLRRALKRDKAWLAGLSCAMVRSEATTFVERVLWPQLRSELVARLTQHGAAGDAVWLLTGEPDFIADPIAERLGLAGAWATLCDERAGRFTAAPPRQHPYGAEKLTAARTLAERYGLPLSAVVAYADSISDLPLLAAVGQPVAIAPDRRLRSVATARRWEIDTRLTA